MSTVTPQAEPAPASVSTPIAVRLQSDGARTFGYKIDKAKGLA